MVVVGSENTKIEQKGYFGEGDKQSECGIVSNVVGGKQRDLAVMSEDLRNPVVHVGEKSRE